MNPASNFAKAATFIRSAATHGCVLAVLPEYHLTNWLPKDPHFRTLCADWHIYLRKYQALAKECNICIVPGTIVQTPSPSSDSDNSGLPPPLPSTPTKVSQTDRNGDLENVAYFISNTGAILGKYVKKNLWGPTERDHLTSSGRDVHPAFETPLGKVGMLICWDLAFPEAFRELVCQGVKMVIVPTFWTLSDCSDAGLRYNPSAEVMFLDSALTARAFENTCGAWCKVFSHLPSSPQFVLRANACCVYAPC